MSNSQGSPTPRPVPRVAKGFRDVFAADVETRRAMVETIRSVYERYGFEPLETPAVEHVDVLGKFLPESDKPDGGIFAWKLIEEGDSKVKEKGDGEWVALRYDLTAPLSRVVAQYKESLPAPFRRYQIGPVYRMEKPGPGRFREFYQFDIDTVGAATMAADAEVCCVLADCLEALGIKRGDYVIKVNNRKVLAGVLESIGLSENRGWDATEVNLDYPRQDESGKMPSQSELDRYEKELLQYPSVRAGIVLRAIDKLDKLGIEGIVHLLGRGRMDASGAFSAGAMLKPEQIRAISGFVNGGDADRKIVIARLRELVGASSAGLEGIRELEQIDELLTSAGYGNDRVQFDPSIVRGLAYYTGPVFEAQLTFDIIDEDGVKRPFGAVAGGGRYDDLVKRFTGELVPATGASIGVDRLLAALKVVGRVNTTDRRGPVVVTVMDKPKLAEYQKMVFELRQAGIAAELYLGAGGFKQQLKYADKRNSPVAVIAGSNEFDKGEITLKNLKLGKILAQQVESRDEWRKGQPAQITIPRASLVDEVKKMVENA